MQYDKSKYMTHEIKSDVIRNTLLNYKLSKPKMNTTVLPNIKKEYFYIFGAAIILIIIVNNK